MEFLDCIMMPRDLPGNFPLSDYGRFDGKFRAKFERVASLTFRKFLDCNGIIRMYDIRGRSCTLNFHSN